MTISLFLCSEISFEIKSYLAKGQRPFHKKQNTFTLHTPGSGDDYSEECQKPIFDEKTCNLGHKNQVGNFLRTNFLNLITRVF